MIADIEQTEIFCTRPIVAFRLHIHLPLPAKAVEVIDEISAHERLQRFVNLREFHAFFERFVAVHIDVDVAGQSGGRWC